MCDTLGPMYRPYSPDFVQRTVISKDLHGHYETFVYPCYPFSKNQFNYSPFAPDLNCDVLTHILYIGFQSHKLNVENGKIQNSTF